MDLESLKILSNSAFQLNLLFGLIKLRNGFMISLNEYAHVTWLTKPNHDLASVRSLGVVKSLIPDKMLSDGVNADGVIVKQEKVSLLTKLKFFVIDYNDI